MHSKPSHLIFSFIGILLLTGLLAGCRKNKYKVDISSIDVNISIERLENDLFGAGPDSIALIVVPSLIRKYGSFLQYFSDVINTGDIDDPGFGDYLARFCTDRLNNEVYGEVKKLYPDVRWIETDLKEAFRYWLYYFPGRNVPRVYTCTTGFNYSIIPGDSVLGIGLDSYLGSGNDFYRRLEIHKYIASRMTKENIIPDAIHGWGEYNWDYNSMGYEKDNVLTRIIHGGKLKYFEKCMLPDVSDSLIQGFTEKQLKFCNNNEEQMWTYLIENDLLFNTEQFTIRKLTGEAPFTSYFTNESPGRAAVWIGFRIVEQYMDKNQGVKLEDLMKDTDVQKILELSKYNPK
jgi:hypothetical protein